MFMLLANAVAVGVQTDHMAVQQSATVPQAVKRSFKGYVEVISWIVGDVLKMSVSELFKSYVEGE